MTTSNSKASSRSGSWLFSLTGRRLSGKSRELLESMQEEETSPTKAPSSPPRRNKPSSFLTKRTSLVHYNSDELYSTTSSQSVDKDFENDLDYDDDVDDERHTVDEWIMSSADSSTSDTGHTTSHSVSSSSSSSEECQQACGKKSVQFAHVTVHYHAQIILVAKDIQENPEQTGLASFALGWERVRSEDYETIGHFEKNTSTNGNTQASTQQQPRLPSIVGSSNKCRTQALRISRDLRRAVFEQVAQQARVSRQ